MGAIGIWRWQTGSRHGSTPTGEKQYSRIDQPQKPVSSRIPIERTTGGEDSMELSGHSNADDGMNRHSVGLVRQVSTAKAPGTATEHRFRVS